MMDSSSWNATNVNEKPEECNSSKEREARSLALEKAYVHDVYQQISSHFTDSRYRAWPKVKQFVVDLEPGSVICDVGCGNGKYLSFNPSIYKIGLDRCVNLTNIARQKDHEVLICDNLALPFRDECFDAVLSVAVIHHFATTERRVAALQELARVLRIGGRLMVSVWAMEQRHRRFESQDVLVPWNRPLVSSSDDKTSSIERDLNSTTTTTSDDDATHYHAYTQTSDSDSFPSLSGGYRKRGRVRHRGRSIDPACPSSSQSSSDLSSPNESCYSFVRRALQKLAGTKRNRGGRKPWFLQGLEIPPPRETNERFGSLEDDGINVELPSANPPENFMPIELRQLESNEFTELFDETRRNKGQRGIILSNVLYPRRRRTLETTCDIQQPNASPINAQPKSKSLSDLFGLIPVGILRSQKKSTEELLKQDKNSGHCLKVVLSQGNLTDADGSCVNSNGNLDGEMSSNQPINFSDSVRHKSVQTDSLELVEVLVSSGDLNGGNMLNNNSCNHCSHLTKSNYSSSANTSIDSQHSDKIPSKKLRPTLVKQKHSISSSFTNNSLDVAGGGNGCSDCTSQGMMHDTTTPIVITSANKNDDGACWRDMKNSVRNLPEFKAPAGEGVTGSHRATLMAGSSFWKQTSLNEDLIFTERLREKEKLKQHIQKQCSLNEELIYKRQENTRWDQMKEAFLNSSNVKCLQLLKNGLSSRFRGNNSGAPVVDPSRYTQGSPDPQYLQPTLTKPATPPSSSLRHGLVRILQNWKQGDEGTNCSSLGTPSGLNPQFLNSRRGSKEPSTPRRGLFPPFFLRRSSAGSLNLSKANNSNETNKAKLSPPPHLKRRPSENELLHEGGMGSINGNCTKLLPGVRHVRKLSREEGSDSSKDSSFQSDTSVDSEDSFASVIFIPKAGGVDPLGGGEGVFSNSETRANSTDSDRSPKSPASRLSPPNHVPKSPSPLASEILRRRSPEFSPTKDKFNLVAPPESTKFVFDETVTQDLRCLPADLPLSIKISEEPTEPEIETKVVESHNTIPVFATTSKNYTFPEAAVEVAKEEPFVENQSFFGDKGSTTLQAIPPFNSKTSTGKTNSSTTSSSKSTSTSTRKKVEKIEVLRKPGVLLDTKTGFTRQLVRRSFPKALAVELFNPETDDADTSDTSSSSPNSVSSVVSVVNEPLFPSGASEETDSEKKYSDSRSKEEAEEHLIKAESLESEDLPPLPFTKQYPTLISMSTASLPEQSLSEPHRETCEVNWRVGSLDMKTSGRKSMSTGLLETATTVVSSLETLVSHSSPKTKRKLTLARLGTTSEWLSSLPTDISGGSSSSSSSTNHKRTCGERRHAGEKMLLGEVKKFQPKGPDAKWPSCIMDDSPPQTAKPPSEKELGEGPSGESSLGGGDSGLGAVSAASTISQTTSELTSKLIEEMEEKDSLFDSLENLNLGKLEPSPSRNPSIDSSVRMSSTCSCSIRGGDSFDSWTSAKSSLTNSSSTHNKTSLSSIIPVQVQLAKPMGYGVSSSTCGGKSGKSSGGSGATSSKCSAAGVDSEDSTALTYHRYYHVFREGELDKLIEKYVQNLHIISSYYDHANWCIVAEKVQVWTI